MIKNLIEEIRKASREVSAGTGDLITVDYNECLNKLQVSGYRLACWIDTDLPGAEDRLREVLGFVKGVEEAMTA